MEISGWISGKVKKIEVQAKWRFSYKKNVYSFSILVSPKLTSSKLAVPPKWNEQKPQK